MIVLCEEAILLCIIPGIGLIAIISMLLGQRSVWKWIRKELKIPRDVSVSDYIKTLKKYGGKKE